MYMFCFIAGFGTFLQEPVPRGKFLLEYRGELLGLKEAKAREDRYRLEDGRFMFFFSNKGKTMWWVILNFTWNKHDIVKLKPALKIFLFPVTQILKSY